MLAKRDFHTSSGICSISNAVVHFQVVEEEAAKRIELLVKKRVDEELEKRKDEIESEVAKRVEEAKRLMEKEMMAEMERQRERQRLEEKCREVIMFLGFFVKNFTIRNSILTM